MASQNVKDELLFLSQALGSHLQLLQDTGFEDTPPQTAAWLQTRRLQYKDTVFSPDELAELVWLGSKKPPAGALRLRQAPAEATPIPADRVAERQYSEADAKPNAPAEALSLPRQASAEEAHLPSKQAAEFQDSSLGANLNPSMASPSPPRSEQQSPPASKQNAAKSAATTVTPIPEAATTEAASPHTTPPDTPIPKAATPDTPIPKAATPDTPIPKAATPRNAVKSAAAVVQQLDAERALEKIRELANQTTRARAGSVTAAPPVASEAVTRRASQALVSLEVLQTTVAECTECELHSIRSQSIFSRGTGKSGLCFVGDSPEQADSGTSPFTGPAGELLDRMITAMGLEVDDVYICNVIKCQTTGDDKATAAQRSACSQHLEGQLSSLRPQVIVALGATAVHGVLGLSMGISRLRGQWRLYNGRIPVMPTFHPAYLLRQPSAKRQVWADLQTVLKQLRGDL